MSINCGAERLKSLFLASIKIYIRWYSVTEIILKPGEKILRSEEKVDVSFKGEVSLGKVLMFGVLGLAVSYTHLTLPTN